MALRRVLTTNTSQLAQVTQAYLAINANINEFQPPINTINTTTQTTSTTVNSVDNVVQSTATRVNNTAICVSNVAKKLDDVVAVNNLRTKLDYLGELVQRTFNKVGEVFQEITKRLDKWARWFRLPMLLDALSFILLLHNAAMLSSNVLQTVGEILNTGLQIIGVQKKLTQLLQVRLN